MSDDLLAFMRRSELKALEAVEAGPVFEPGYYCGWDSEYEHLRLLGYVYRHRGHPRCGQDEHPPAWFTITAEGKRRLAELRTAPQEG